jgi:pimeloyl-ACP methyl ester carboxylesterase
MAMTSAGSSSKKRGNRRRTGADRRAPARSVVARSAVGRPAASRVFAAYRMKDDEIEAGLATGEHAVALESYFGEGGYAELRHLAPQAQARGVRGGPRVLILPGIMGSKLGFRRPLLDDVVWIDPVDFTLGNIARLAYDGVTSKVEALGVVLLAYLKLKLTLQIASFDVAFHPFDWRQPIPVLGAALADRIARDGRDVHLVAHSMGGLVARAALKKGLPQVKRLIMLGTPNYGSFAVPQALRGKHSMVRMVAALDVGHSAEELVDRVFSTFPGLYQMMPWREKFSAMNLYDAAAWPSKGPRPRQALLNAIEPAHAALAAPDDRFALIAGINRDTVVGASVVGDELAYVQSRDGDGTVPVDMARLPGVPTYYIDEEHGSLPNNSLVADTTIDLLRHPTSDRLPTTWTPRRDQRRRSLRDAQLGTEPFGGRRGRELSPSEVRQVLTGFASPPAPGGAAPLQALAPSVAQPATDAGRSLHVVVGRRRQHRLDVTLAHGSITDVNARAYVLGVFKEVDPSGAALAIDARLSGAISEFSTRRMISGGVGEMFVMPVGRSSLQTDMVVLAGMGTFDTFTPAVQSLVAENIIRLFVRTRVDEFATVLLGSGSGASVRQTLANMCAGFVRALGDTGGAHRFRRIVLSEQDPERFLEVKQALYELASSQMFDDTEVTIDEVALSVSAADAGSAAPSRRDRLPGGRDPVYAIVRESPRSDGDLTLEVALLGAGGAAAVVNGEARVPRATLEGLLARIETPGFSFDGLPGYGAALAALVLPANVRARLATMADRHLVIVHDTPSSRIPWETLHLDKAGAGAAPASGKKGTKGVKGAAKGAKAPKTPDKDGWAPALGCGMSRRYLAENLSVAKWLEERREDGFLDVLLVVDPTGTLPGAKKEAERLRKALGATSAVRVTVIQGAQGTRTELLRQFTSGKYDMIHFAGHAFFDPRVPARSGILCAGDEVLSGADLAQRGNLPSLVFFNACEAGRIRRGASARDGELAIVKRLGRSTSFAEAFLRGGVVNYVGTYWPVGDDPATLFAEIFYGELLAGKTVSQALLAGRRALRDEGELDWADYIHYGSPDFVLKTGARAASAPAPSQFLP